MMILVEPSEYRLLNAGDTAMMQVAMERLCSMWPEARIHVFTSHPDLLPRYSIRVAPLPNTGRLLWLSERLIPSRLIPWRTASDWSWSRSFCVQQPQASRALRRLRYWSRNPGDRESVEEFLGLMRGADLFVVTGMGGLTSAFPGYGAMVVDTLALAQAIGVPTVLFGQGIGPFDVLDARLEARTRNVLRRADYIGLREGQHGPELLRSWGIPPERWSVTGDDALELAIPYRSDRERHAIGVNVRKADYSAVSLDVIVGLREPLQHAAASLAAPLRAIPISRLPEEDDARQIETLFLGYNAVEHSESALNSPNRIIEEIQHCRVVVTGSYHAGVFALAQGIPVIGLAANDYYQWKFDGLAHQFGDGCSVLRLGAPGSFARLRHMIVQLFQAAPTLRSALLASADRQVDAGKAAYEHVKSLVDRRRAGIPCKCP